MVDVCWAYMSSTVSLPALSLAVGKQAFCLGLPECCLSSQVSALRSCIFHLPAGQLGFFAIYDGLRIPSTAKANLEVCFSEPNVLVTAAIQAAQEDSAS